MAKKNFSWWILFILLCIWQLPQLLVGLVMIPFLGNIALIADRHYNLCFVGDKMSGGISLGPLSFVSQYLSHYAADVSHEVDGHTIQSKILGPFYLFIIGLPSLIHAWLYDSSKSCYFDYWTESWANKCAGLEVDERCNLKFQKKEA